MSRSGAPPATARTVRPAAEETAALPSLEAPRPLTFPEWLRFGPFLAHLIVTRRCNLSCAYCTEFDKTSEPVPFDTLAARLARLRALKTWAICLTGGEPTLHPRLVDLVAEARRLGFPRRQMITNGLLLTRELIEDLNDAGLTDLQISVDGVAPNKMTVKTLRPLRERLLLLEKHARFDVVMSGVIGSAPPAEAIEVIEFARAHGFRPRVLLLHGPSGQIDLSPEELAAYRQVKRQLGSGANESGDYRGQLIATGRAPFKCRAGSRYIYVDEFGKVNWCAQTRGVYTRELSEYGLDDLMRQFEAAKPCNERCTVGCARSASRFDEWRAQDPAPVEHPAPAPYRAVEELEID